MTYYLIEPEVAGGLGKHTVMNRNTFPPQVKKLHYYFDGWSGDELLTSFPCYIVTKKLSEDIKKNNLKGVEFNKVEVSKSEEFKDMYPNKNLPPFVWMKVVGEARKDDFGIEASKKRQHLAISARALDVLKRHSLNNCIITSCQNGSS